MSNWQAGLERKIEMKTDEYHRKLARLIEFSQKTARELVHDTAKRFAGAARNAMPPDEGSSRISKAATLREIKDISDPATWTGGAAGKVNRNAHFGGKYSFAVPFRGPSRRGIRFFVSRAEADAFAEIPTRGAARYGWAQATVALGGKAPAVVPARFAFAGNAARLMAKAGSTTVSGSNDNPRVEIENHSTAAGPMHLMKSELAGRRIAVSGLTRGIKAAEQKMENAF